MLAIIGIIAGISQLASAYIPAQPTNNTLPVNDTQSYVTLYWHGGQYGREISFQLEGSGSVGFSRVCTASGSTGASTNNFATGSYRSLFGDQLHEPTSLRVSLHSSHFL